MKEKSRRSLAIAATAALLLVAGCATSASREGLDESLLPSEVRAEYAVFARRCSKCHALARALNSGIDQDPVWASYVARMRRQPGSGISQQDAQIILRFLHYFSLEQQRLKRERHPGAPPVPPQPRSGGG
jgi:hypothetical protein